jgi:taurine--2-oxoglutarate transaminase
MKRLLERGLYLFAKWDFMFLCPPLIITDDELAESMAIIDEALNEADELARAASP